MKFIISFIWIIVLKCHSVKPDVYDIKLLDQYGTPVNKESIPLLVTKFKNSSSFFIELKLNSVKRKVDTPAEIRKVSIWKLVFMCYLSFLYSLYIISGTGKFFA